VKRSVDPGYNGTRNRTSPTRWIDDRALTSLKGHLLIAAPGLLDPMFARSVVLLLDHDEAGAMGYQETARLVLFEKDLDWGGSGIVQS
jgi:hypothetical protein